MFLWRHCNVGPTRPPGNSCVTDIAWCVLCTGCRKWPTSRNHYNGAIMSAMASWITSLLIVYSTVYSDADQRKHQSSASLALVRGIHRSPVNSLHKRASNAENVSIWWRHHAWYTSRTAVRWTVYHKKYSDDSRFAVIMLWYQPIHSLSLLYRTRGNRMIDRLRQQ